MNAELLEIIYYQLLEMEQRLSGKAEAIEKATNVHETELAAVAKEGMPNIPGMDMFK